MKDTSRLFCSDDPTPLSTVEAMQPMDSSLENSSLKGKRVVICEDEGVTQMQLRRALTKAGLSVVGAAINGAEGVEIALREQPDIILMDIRMPIMDGLEATERIMEAHPVCIVMLTAFEGEDFQQKAQRLGASGYVVKPVTGDVLLPEIHKAFQTFQNRLH